MISQHQENAKGKVRVVAILLLILEVGLMFAYGFGSQFQIGGTTFPTTSDNTSSLIFYMTSAIMALLGWGLIIAYS
jgi:ABC-type polysaccharide transport system permease subunit